MSTVNFLLLRKCKFDAIYHRDIEIYFDLRHGALSIQ